MGVENMGELTRFSLAQLGQHFGEKTGYGRRYAVAIQRGRINLQTNSKLSVDGPVLQPVALRFMQRDRL